MRDVIKDRALGEALYIVETKSTVRTTAKAFGVSKSTVHRDMTVVLSEYDPEIRRQVSSVLEENHLQSHIRGGIATKKRWENVMRDGCRPVVFCC
jgi:putative DeoR family transcriptional regulator (stage III sporulation protein D)